MDQRYFAIYAFVRRIPWGRIATYGQVAAAIGFPRHSRMVGRALRALPQQSDVPWHRVVNSLGRISKRTSSDHDELQHHLLQAEGVELDDSGRLVLEQYRWDDPDDRPSAGRR